ncbi:MAG TPA: hypothetical protein VH479_03915, partial [Acidimicrobiales bacterium]
DEQLEVLVGSALDLMGKVLRPLAVELTTLPVGPAHPGRTAGFAFEMYYVMGNMTPHREPAWALLAERARILAGRCGEIATGRSPTLEPARDQARAIADTLTRHVPEALRPAAGSD